MKRSLRRVLLALWFLFITYLFLLPGQAFPSKSWLYELGFDKVVHFTLFFVLLILCCWSFWPAQNKSYLALFLSAVVYGLLVEICQDRFIEHRTFAWNDLMANALGALVALVGWYKKNKPL